MAAQTHTSASYLNVADVTQQFDRFKSDRDISSSGLVIINENRVCCLTPLARKLFTAPASFAASERVVVRAGAIMRPSIGIDYPKKH